MKSAISRFLVGCKKYFRNRRLKKFLTAAQLLRPSDSMPLALSITLERFSDADLDHAVLIQDSTLNIKGKIYPVEQWGELFELPNTPDQSQIDRFVTLQAFDWLKDFEALHDTQIQEKLKPAVQNWMETSLGSKDITGWSPLTAARRAKNICLSLPVLRQVLSDADIVRILQVHEKYLSRCLTLKGLDFASLWACHLGGCYLGLILDHRAVLPRFRDLSDILTAQEHAVSAYFLTPADRTELCADLVALDYNFSCHSVSNEQAIAFQDMIAGLLRDISAVRLGDGGVATFNAGAAQSVVCPERLLSLYPSAGRTGKNLYYHSLKGGRTHVVLDTARHHASASALAFEMSIGRRRFITSCAGYDGMDIEWKNALMHRAAHSTLVLENSGNSVARRMSSLDGNGIIQETEHGAWIQSCCTLGEGRILYDRHLYLSRDGSDFRGSDSITSVRLDDTNKKSPHQHQSQRFFIRFHLYPDVTATLNERKTKVILTLPTQERWYMQHSGAATLTLESSVYCGGGGTQQSCQIVVTGEVKALTEHTDEKIEIEWVFRKFDVRKASVRDIEHVD